jgi:hypothetical protein
MRASTHAYRDAIQFINPLLRFNLVEFAVVIDIVIDEHALNLFPFEAATVQKFMGGSHARSLTVSFV